MSEKKPIPLPLGKSLFDEVIEEGCYYVDKTLFIRDILDGRSEVTLCTRPRRFGKTLAQTMLKCFFEDTAPIGGKDTRALFNGLKIEAAGEQYMAHQGKYPVIFLSFKDAGDNDFDVACRAFKGMIAEEFRRHDYAMEKIVKADDLEMFKELSSGKVDISQYRESLKFLCRCLWDYHGQKAIILIDEYDVPLQKSWLCGYYDEMVNFIRPLLGGALKDNPHLQFAVMTGCLRISKESIFTGLNNPTMISILDTKYSEYFGFTQDEMGTILKHYGLESKTQIVRDWYDGYLFGNTEVYNPWSALHVVDRWLSDIDRLPVSYWVNTSGNEIVRDLINMADDQTKAELGTLMTGGIISKAIHEDITYDEVYKTPDNLWIFMFFTGYLRKVGKERLGKDGELILDLSIPNNELRYIYARKIQEWFNEQVKQRDFSKLYDAILSGNAEVLQEELGDFLLGTISYMDGREDFYHGIMLGVLSGMGNYSLKSNREAGLGRCDIVMRHRSGRGKAVIFELKWTTKMKEIEKKRDEALKQIANGKYIKELEEECYNDVIKYGIAFCQKSCEVGKLE